MSFKIQQCSVANLAQAQVLSFLELLACDLAELRNFYNQIFKVSSIPGQKKRLRLQAAKNFSTKMTSPVFRREALAILLVKRRRHLLVGRLKESMREAEGTSVPEQQTSPQQSITKMTTVQLVQEIRKLGRRSAST